MSGSPVSVIPFPVVVTRLQSGCFCLGFDMSGGSKIRSSKATRYPVGLNGP